MIGKTAAVADKIIELVRKAPAGGIFHDARIYDQDHDADTGTSEGFRDSCDDYSASTFMLEADGRTYMVTIEDVTIKREGGT